MKIDKNDFGLLKMMVEPIEEKKVMENFENLDQYAKFVTRNQEIIAVNMEGRTGFIELNQKGINIISEEIEKKDPYVKRIRVG